MSEEQTAFVRGFSDYEYRKVKEAEIKAAVHSVIRRRDAADIAAIEAKYAPKER